MVETGDAPSDGSWERSEYDVRYYLVSSLSSLTHLNTYLLLCQVDFSHATQIADNQQVGLDLRHAAQSIKTIAGQVCVLSVG